MNKSIVLCVVIFCIVLFGKTFTNIKGEGSGISSDEALMNAKRNALERSVGIILSSKSIAQNNMIISDKILSKSEGYIKKYKVIKTSVDNDIHKITINADITNLIDDIQKDEFAIKFLIQEMGFPKFEVIIRDKNGKIDKFAENIIVDNFIKSHFDVYKVPDDDSTKADDKKIDFIVEGTIDYSTAEIKAYDIKNMFSVHTKIGCNIRSLSDDKIISINKFSSKKAHFDPEEAKRQSISLCSDKISKFLIKDSIEKWNKYYNQDFRKIDINISNISFEISQKLNNKLKYIFSGIETIESKKFNNRTQKFVISSFLATKDILEIISKELLDLKFKINVNSISDNEIDIELN